jgi:hypothetical protein
MPNERVRFRICCCMDHCACASIRDQRQHPAPWSKVRTHFRIARGGPRATGRHPVRGPRGPRSGHSALVTQTHSRRSPHTCIQLRGSGPQMLFPYSF